MAKVLINNTALRNNGDVALVRSLGHALRLRGHRVVVCGRTAPRGRTGLAGEPVRDDVAGYRWKIFRRPVLADIAALWLLLSDREYRNADMIVGAPGGYLNSFYGFRWKLRIFHWAKLLGKKTAIYSQSVGPLNRQDADCLRSAARYIDVLVVRDELSQHSALQSGFRKEAILRSEDAVFLSPPRHSLQSADSNTVFVSVRDWQHDGRDFGRYVELIQRLVGTVLSRGFDVEFVSTCQGIEGYVDDSRIADSIVDTFPGDRSRLVVCRDRLSIEQLERRIDAARFVIGTRLHMCLLAMIAGIPAFNISYEAKGTECYKYLGLAANSVDYNEDPSTAALRLEDFMDNLEALRAVVSSRVARHHESSNACLDEFLVKSGVTLAA